MEVLTSPKLNYLLEGSAAVLHEESKEWLSEILFWKDELKFFEKLLQKISLRIKDNDEFKRVEHLQNKIIYYKDELLDEMRHDVKEHEKYLARFSETKQLSSERSYKEKHKMLLQHINAFILQYKELKKEIFGFAEKIL